MLPKDYDPALFEKEMQALWEREQIYRFVPDGREIFSIDTPPPTVSGSLHIGHIFSYTQAEIVARFMRMQGKNVFYPFGFDDNGLPSERLTEKEHGVSAAETDRGEFTALCRETARKYIGEFRALWQTMGFSCDWELGYETAGELAQRISQRSFIKLAKSGRAYRKETPVLWCPFCRTSIAQAELETAERDTTFNTLPFRVGSETVPVATTRPELLFGCTALFVHPQDGRYRHLIGQIAEVPLYGFSVPILQNPDVGMEKGTGAVMCATFGDTADLKWFEEYRLPYRRVVEPDGRLSPEVPEIGGLKIAAARAKILEILRQRGLLLNSEPLRHTVAVHERCGHEIEILPSRQWFIGLLPMKERLLAAADEIEWRPETMKARYLAWVRGLKWDWCVSRQRPFGVPLPVWYCRDCGRPVFAGEAQLPVNPCTAQPDAPCACGCREFVPETAVMDTWATSSLTPFINARAGEEGERPLLPMSLHTQAHEIIRTWAFYSIARSLYETGAVPWKAIMISGYVTDKTGAKISKSKGNGGPAPGELLKSYGADALRCWSAGARLGTDTAFSPGELKIAGRFLTKLWNAARFSLGLLDGYDGKTPPTLLPVDALLLYRTERARLLAQEALTRCDTGAARREIDDLFWNAFCDTHIELVKDRLYHPERHGDSEAASGRFALYHGLRAILQLYAPFVPHITEAVWQSFYRPREGEISIHRTLWQPLPQGDPLPQGFGAAVEGILSGIRRYKSEKGLSLRAPLGTVLVTAPEACLPALSLSAGDLTSCCALQSLQFSAGETLAVNIRESCI